MERFHGLKVPVENTDTLHTKIIRGCCYSIRLPAPRTPTRSVRSKDELKARCTGRLRAQL